MWLQDLDGPRYETEYRAEMQNRERRALAAYWRKPGYDYPQTPDIVEHVEHEGNEYVVLTSEVAGGCLAVYRIRRDGQLKRLKRPPDFRRDARVFHRRNDDDE